MHPLFPLDPPLFDMVQDTERSFNGDSWAIEEDLIDRTPVAAV